MILPASLSLLVIAYVGLLACWAQAADFVLDKELIQLSITVSELSAALFDLSNEELEQQYNATVYLEEPDRAVVARIDGICFAVFRGTTSTFEDWLQNFDISWTEAGTSGRTCQVRDGFHEAYNAGYRQEFEQDLRECAATCSVDEDICTVLAGHSQGGAVATVASLYLHDLNPALITIGPPVAVEENCTYVPIGRQVRYINTIVDPDDGDDGLLFDIVPLTPELGSENFGHTVIFSPQDDQNVVYYPDGEGPVAELRRLEADAHGISLYKKRLEVFLAQDIPAIGLDGWSTGLLCSVDHDCQTNMCRDKDLLGDVRECSAGNIGDACDSDSDCQSDRCVVTSHECGESGLTKNTNDSSLAASIRLSVIATFASLASIICVTVPLAVL